MINEKWRVTLDDGSIEYNTEEEALEKHPDRTPVFIQEDLTAQLAEIQSQLQAEQLKQEAQAELDISDKTMVRLIDAVVRGATTFTAPDAVAFSAYRYGLREVVRGNSSVKPTKPDYPQGT